MAMKEAALKNASQLRKWTVFVIGVALYILVYFYRFAPAVIAEPMSIDLNVSEASIGFFTTMYFWPYAIMQPLIGSLSDIFDPGILIGLSGTVSSLGTVICALSDSLWVAYFGRFIVGLGCSSVFVPMLKVLSMMFTREQYVYIPGLFLVFGGVGGLMAQLPLAAMCHSFGWRASLIVLAAVGLVFSILAFTFIHAPPEDTGNGQFKTLLSNIVTVLTYKNFWYISLFSLAIPGAYMDVGTFWGIPYLRQVFGMSLETASSVAVSLSLGLILFPPIFSVIAVKAGSKKMVLFACSIFGALTCFFLAFFGVRMSTIGLFISLFVFSSLTSASQSVSLAMYAEMADKSLTATITGCGNAFPFVGAAAAQMVSSAVIGSYGDSAPYPPAAFKYGLWIVCGIFCVVGAIGPLFYRKPIVVSDDLAKEINP